MAQIDNFCLSCHKFSHRHSAQNLCSHCFKAYQSNDDRLEQIEQFSVDNSYNMHEQWIDCELCQGKMLSYKRSEWQNRDPYLCATCLSADNNIIEFIRLLQKRKGHQNMIASCNIYMRIKQFFWPDCEWNCFRLIMFSADFVDCAVPFLILWRRIHIDNKAFEGLPLGST